MPKNIVICADGTGNTFEKNVSNIPRLVRSLDLSDDRKQIVFYDQGVGTRRTRAATEYAQGKRALRILPEPRTAWWIPRPFARWLGLGFGYGLYENVREMYEALVTHYEEGDRVYLFGFSRGAFTVRALAGFVHRCRLLPKDRLDKFSEAYNCLYGEQHYEAMERQSQRDDFTRTLNQFREDNRVTECQIHFLGIWDTVKSYGFIYPVSLPHLRHNPSVMTVRHALALHERRSYYQPTSWGGVDHPFYDDVRPDDSIDVKEVWFAGSHSDVGGGYEQRESGLARSSFEWMLREARAGGLSLDDRGLQTVAQEFSDDRVLHESLHGYWWLSECLPRFELQNIPMAGKRVLRWGSTGQRDPLQMIRGKSVCVHSSVHEVYSSLGLALIRSQDDRNNGAERPGGLTIETVVDTDSSPSQSV